MAETADKCNCPCIRSLLSTQISASAAHLLFWPVFVVGLAVDLWTKSLVFDWLSSLSSRRYTVLAGFFQLVLVENRGAAWGIAAGKTIPLILISIVAIVIVFAVFLFAGRPRAVIVFSLGLFAAGICGNLYDRVFNNGGVRDFLDFYYGDIHFPAFNIADSMLTVAVFILIIATVFCQKPQTENSEYE